MPIERCIAIKKYFVRFVVAQHDDATVFKNFSKRCDGTARVVFEINGLILLKLSGF